MTMTICPACDRPAHTEDITDGLCPDCRDNATAHELRAEVRRLRTREATLAAALERYANKCNWLVRGWRDALGNERSGLVHWDGPTDEGPDLARRALAGEPLGLAADLSALATERTP